MGMEQTVTFPAGSPCSWPAARALLASRGFPVQVRMIDGELSSPDEEPPADDPPDDEPEGVPEEPPDDELPQAVARMTADAMRAPSRTAIPLECIPLPLLGLGTADSP